jgi:hypothetical protein
VLLGSAKHGLQQIPSANKTAHNQPAKDKYPTPQDLSASRHAAKIAGLDGKWHFQKIS